MAGKKPKRVWPYMMMLMVSDEDIIRTIVERVREEFGMAAPVEPACVTLNRARSRESILARVEELCAETTWKGDLEWVHIMFHPDDPPQEAKKAIKDADLPPATRLLLESITDVLGPAIAKAGYAGIRFRIVNWLTDYAIQGDFAEIRPMPVMFDSDVVEIPFHEDKLVIALVSRFTDIEGLVDRLRIKRRQAFIKRASNSDPENIERNAWVWMEHERLEVSSPRTGRPARLLNSFLASRWGYQFEGYNLDKFEDQKRAHAALRKMVSRGQKHADANRPTQPPLFCDE